MVGAGIYKYLLPQIISYLLYFQQAFHLMGWTRSIPERCLLLTVLRDLHCWSLPLALKYSQDMRVLHDALRDLLCFRYTLSYLHCGTVVQFFLGNQGQSIQPVVTLFGLLIQKHEEPKMAGCQSHLSVFNGITVMSLGGSIPAFGTETSRPVESKVKRMGTKILLGIVN